MATNFTKLRWNFEILDNYPWLDNLAAHSPDVFILVDMEDGMPDQYFWASPHLNDLVEPQDLIDRGLALKAR
jgi:hypothetical protein